MKIANLFFAILFFVMAVFCLLALCLGNFALSLYPNGLRGIALLEFVVFFLVALRFFLLSRKK